MILWCCSNCFFIGKLGAVYSSCPNGCKDKKCFRTIQDSDPEIIKDVREKLVILRDGTTYKKAVEFLDIYS